MFLFSREVDFSTTGVDRTGDGAFRLLAVDTVQSINTSPTPCQSGTASPGRGNSLNRDLPTGLNHLSTETPAPTNGPVTMAATMKAGTTTQPVSLWKSGFFESSGFGPDFAMSTCRSSGDSVVIGVTPAPEEESGICRLFGAPFDLSNWPQQC
ncbi:unnamed protein product [Protopolystoma xenopodis]|uniref:Uncharacterized protein n=1 Tax=Protopolystoma xenopodis TaxID=117903 RepID=A0A3S5A8Y5_9PLAT|nr:unnamed protein product [Protopolystoma xenopodis]